MCAPLAPSTEQISQYASDRMFRCTKGINSPFWFHGFLPPVVASKKGTEMAGQMNFTDAIALVKQELIVEVARTPEQILDAKQLRYRVYCEERGFEPGQE